MMVGIATVTWPVLKMLYVRKMIVLQPAGFHYNFSPLTCLLCSFIPFKLCPDTATHLKISSLGKSETCAGQVKTDV